MPKYYGKIGYAYTVENPEGSGVWKEVIIERSYAGDLIRNYKNISGSDKINDDINISNEISIVSDPYAIQNFHKIKYVEFMGTKWKVSSVEVLYPRLKLSLGGVYNE